MKRDPFFEAWREAQSVLGSAYTDLIVIGAVDRKQAWEWAKYEATLHELAHALVEGISLDAPISSRVTRHIAARERDDQIHGEALAIAVELHVIHWLKWPVSSEELIYMAAQAAGARITESAFEKRVEHLMSNDGVVGLANQLYWAMKDLANT